jgi:hypothetical protein
MDPGSRPALEPLPDLSVETPLDAAPSRPGPRPAAAAPAAGPPAGLDDEEAQALAFMDPELQLSPSQSAARPSPGSTVVIPVPATAPRPYAGESRSIDQSLEALDSVSSVPAVTPSSRPELTLEEIDAAAAQAAAKPAPGPTSAPTPAPSPALPELTLEDRDVERVLASGSPAVEVTPARLAEPARSPAATAPPVIPVPVVSAPTVAPAPARPAPAAVPPARPAPPAKARAPTPAPAGPARAAPVSSSDAAAKRASLSAAAVKLAAASAAGANGRAAKATPSASPPPTPVAAPSLTDWASARAAAAAKVVAPSAAAPPRAAQPPTLSAAPAPAAAPAAPASAPASASAAAAPAVAPSPPMDRDFIARNQVVERYLSGRLPLKGATEFERYCHDHPELLDEIGLPERVNAGLRLLEASGKPEPWQEAPRPAWQQPAVTIGLAAGVVVLAIALAIASGSSASKTHRIADLQKQVADRTLDAATSTRDIRLVPSRSGASNSPAITIGGGDAQLADFRIDESHSPYHLFRVTIDRVDEGRVGVINNLAKDSNGHLRIALNSSALGPGVYQLTLEGIDWHGEPQPDSWVTIGVQH